MRKNYIWNTLGTTFLSFNSLFFMIIVTRLNGIEDGGIFSFAFATAGIINFLALYYGRTYQIADENIKYSESLFVLSRYITSFLAFIIAIFFICMNDYTFEKSIVILFLCLVKCFEAVSDIYYGIVQKRDKLYIAGKSLTYKSLLSLFGFALLDYLTGNIWIACFYLVVLNILFLIFYDMYFAKKEIRINMKCKLSDVASLLKQSSYTFLFTFIVLIIINIPRYFIDFYLTDTDQGIYGIISMPATFIILFSQFILQPSLVQLTHYYKSYNKGAYIKTIIKISSMILGSLILILPAAYIMGIPVLEFIYNVELSQYRSLLMLIILGSAFYAVSNVLLNALIVIKCSKEQLVVQIVVLICSLLISYYLISLFGLDGGILSYFIILLLQFVFYGVLFKIIVNIKFKERGSI